MSLIKIENQLVKFSEKLLGTPEVWLWVGGAYGPQDNDDQRVKETRELMEKYYPYVPYGMWVGNKAGTTMAPLTLSDGFYILDTSWWPVGVYRINLHASAGVESPFGSKLHPERRDQDCSWAPLEIFKDEIQTFLHQEENGAGLSIRFLIRPNRTIEAFGDMVK